MTAAFRYFTSLLLTFALCLPCSIAYADVEDEGSTTPPKEETETPKDKQEDTEKKGPTVADTFVSGLIEEQALEPSAKFNDKISVTPAYGRVVNLQKLASGKWSTVATYTTANSASASVTLSYPNDKWAKSTSTKWRIQLPETSAGKAFTSKEILLYTMNRKDLKLNGKAAVVMNASTGRVLYSKNMNKRREQASITKVMTAILAIENNSLSKKVKLSKKVVKTPWTYMPYKKGDKVRINDLLYAAMLPSSNGSATALAEGTSGSVAKFAKLMNAKAKELGMTGTRYVNAHGLTAKNHYSTAYDTALLMSYAYKNPTFQKVIGTKRHSFKTAKLKKSCSVKTTNELLGKVSGMKGGKTGTTDEAGACFTGVYKYKGKAYVTVALGCSSHSMRFADTRKMISYIKKYGW